MKLALRAALIGAALAAGASTASATTWTWQDDFPSQRSFADRVALWGFGTGYTPNLADSVTGSTSPCNANVTSAPLGPPDGAEGCSGFTSLGEGGWIVLEFIDNVLKGDGDIWTADLGIFEAGALQEAFYVSIASVFDPLAMAFDWVSLGRFPGTSYIDIDRSIGATPDKEFRYVLIWDDPAEGNGYDQGIFAGMDIDSVGTLHDPAPIPLPASAALLLAGLGGLAAFRRRSG